MHQGLSTCGQPHPSRDQLLVMSNPRSRSNCLVSKLYSPTLKLNCSVFWNQPVRPLPSPLVLPVPKDLVLCQLSLDAGHWEPWLLLATPHGPAAGSICPPSPHFFPLTCPPSSRGSLRKGERWDCLKLDRPNLVLLHVAQGTVTEHWGAEPISSEFELGITFYKGLLQGSNT